MRVPGNTNLTIFEGNEFRRLLLLKGVGPYVLEYLERTYDTIEKAVHQYPRVSAIRFDLRYPAGLGLSDELMTNAAISAFVDSLKSKVANNRRGAKLKYDRVHDSVVRYVWVREYDETDTRPHYHFLLLLNRDAFHTVGYFNSESDNLYHRIVSAWASALGLPPEDGYGLVHMPKNHTYAINMNRSDSGWAELFTRVSYLCKVNTKRFGEGHHAFGCSQI